MQIGQHRLHPPLVARQAFGRQCRGGQDPPVGLLRQVEQDPGQPQRPLCQRQVRADQRQIALGIGATSLPTNRVPRLPSVSVSSYSGWL